MDSYLIKIVDFIDENSALNDATRICGEIVNHQNHKKIILDFKGCKDLPTLFIKNSIVVAMKMMDNPKITVKNIEEHNLMALRYVIKEMFDTKEE